MSNLLVIFVGLISGLHAALYGAYKDSPHEAFLARRFVRELIIAGTISLVMAILGVARGQSTFVLYVSVFCLARLATEFWKLFLRVEPQCGYRIPTQIHWFKGVIHNPLLRVLMGLGMIGCVFGCYKLFQLLPESLPWSETGLIVGGGIGLVEAIGGAYKDGSIEGFSLRKFLKSPTFGAISGFLVSYHTTDLAFLLIGALGSMRMFNELIFKMIVRDYVPGKFRSLEGPFQDWMQKRRYFIPPYAVTWGIYLMLFIQLDRFGG